MGITITMAYDKLNRLVKKTYADGTEESYTYDVNGNETRYEYDGDGRLTRTINLAGRTAEILYDENGYNIGYKGYAGNSTDYIYDENGRLSNVSNADGDMVYAYDGMGRLITVTDSQGVIRYIYDEYSRLASKTTYDYGTIKYTYTGSDKVSCITTNVNGMDIGTPAYEYDLMERIVRVVGNDGSATLYEYDDIGNRTAVKHEGGLTVTYEYDECSRLVNELVTDKDSNVLMYYGYTYGSAGEKTQAIEAVREAADDTDARVVC